MRINRTDVAVGAAILALGAIQFALPRSGEAYVGGDATYLELAESIVEGSSYGYNDTPGTLLPPGFPALLALLCVSVGCDHTTATRAMAAFATLGFLFSYTLIRRVGGRAAAAAACLLPMSSSEVFGVTTGLVFSDPPSFAVTALAIWLALELEETRSQRRRTLLSGLFAATVVACLLVRSAAVALLAGIAAWLLATWLWDRHSIARRLRSFAPALLLGTVVLGGWMTWAASNQVSEWPLEGYPKSYLSQLLIVNGQQPGLGQAHWYDALLRVDNNLRTYTASAAGIVTRHWILPEWASPAISGTLLLLMVGLAVSVARGGVLHDWFFMAYVAMLALWPWDVRIRFLLPVLPLACWYPWRGVLEILAQARVRPRRLGLSLLALSMPLIAVAGGAAARRGSIQAIASLCFWIGLAGAAFWLVRTRGVVVRGGLVGRMLRPLGLTASVAVVVGGLVVIGVVQQLKRGRQNLAFETERSHAYPDMEAAQWLREHTDESAVLMARRVSVVHHHSHHRRVVWFPPLSEIEVLMDGIRRHGVKWIVVAERDLDYWRPKEAEVFESLLEAHPESFELEASGSQWQIFAVSSDSQRQGMQPDVAAGPTEGAP